MFTCNVQIHLHDLMEFAELEYCEFNGKCLSILLPMLSVMSLALISSLLVHAHWCRDPLLLVLVGFDV